MSEEPHGIGKAIENVAFTIGMFSTLDLVLWLVFR